MSVSASLCPSCTSPSTPPRSGGGGQGAPGAPTTLTPGRAGREERGFPGSLRGALPGGVRGDRGWRRACALARGVGEEREDLLPGAEGIPVPPRRGYSAAPFICGEGRQPAPIPFLLSPLPRCRPCPRRGSESCACGRRRAATSVCRARALPPVRPRRQPRVDGARPPRRRGRAGPAFAFSRRSGAARPACAGRPIVVVTTGRGAPAAGPAGLPGRLQPRLTPCCRPSLRRPEPRSPRLRGEPPAGPVGNGRPGSSARTRGRCTCPAG